MCSLALGNNVRICAHLSFNTKGESEVRKGEEIASFVSSAGNDLVLRLSLCMWRSKRNLFRMIRIITNFFRKSCMLIFYANVHMLPETLFMKIRNTECFTLSTHT